MKREKRLLLRAAYITILINKYHEDLLFCNGWKNTLSEKLPIKRWPLQEKDVRKVNEEFLLLDDHDLTEVINTWFKGNNFVKSINAAEEAIERIKILIKDISEITKLSTEEIHEWIVEYELKDIIWNQVEHHLKQKKK